MNPSKPGISVIFAAFLVIFVVCLILANLIAGKVFEIGGQFLTAGIIVFPITYILGDIFTEVYGLRRARFVILTGFAANLFVVLILQAAVALNPAPFYQNQASFATIFTQVPQIVFASLLAYLVGEFVNSLIMVWLKKLTKSRFLWIRTIGSTIIGQFLDSFIFITIALGFNADMIVLQAILKIGYEIIFTPLTYLAVKIVKKYEGIV